MNEKVNLSFTVIGGPHDGVLVFFNGVSEREYVLEALAQMEWEGHVYKITEFDKEKMHATLNYY